jgi:hypothetical protein
MKEIFKYAKVNVQVTDNATSKIIFEDHNLFVDTGRIFIAQSIKGTISGGPITPSYFVCDFGNNATTPTINDIDLASYLSPNSIAVNTPTYPADFAGQPTGVHFQFLYTNATGLDVTIRELGLFYRPDSDQFPLRHSITAAPGTMLARLKTTLSSIVIGNTRTITIDWKVIF